MNQTAQKKETVMERLCRIKASRSLTGAFANVPARVLPADTHVKFELKILNSYFKKYADEIDVKYVRDDHRMDDGSIAHLTPDREYLWQKVKSSVSGDTLTFELDFSGEHEHWVGISVIDGTTEYREDFYFYTLEEDLLKYSVFKGSVHTHSTGSDGLYPPEFVPAYMRQAGYDFTAVTDHQCYEPTLQAIEAMSRFDSGLEVYPGEEAENYGAGITHILSLGASGSISKWEYDPESDFAARVEKVQQELKDYPEHDAKYAAQFEAITSKIKELGGISVFCHPYWKQNARYASAPVMTDIIIRRGNYDALELGNFTVPRMALLNAKVMEAIRDYQFKKPFIGSSDWHGRPSQKATVDYTIIFANSASFADFADAIRSERCVGVGGCNDEFPFGPYRLVKYALFLMDHYFKKIHDPLCAEQGDLILKALNGDETVLPAIAELKKTIEKKQAEFFGRGC